MTFLMSFLWWGAQIFININLLKDEKQQQQNTKQQQQQKQKTHNHQQPNKYQLGPEKEG